MIPGKLGEVFYMWIGHMDFAEIFVVFMTIVLNYFWLRDIIMNAIDSDLYFLN